MERGQCLGSPNDPSPELKKECRAAYLLASILTGVAQLVALLCAPLFGYLSGRARGVVNWPIVASTTLGIAGYVAFPRLPSPEPKDMDGRGGTPFVFLLVSLMGISQIGAIVCSLGSLGRGVLAVDRPGAASAAEATTEDGAGDAENDEGDGHPTGEAAPLLSNGATSRAGSSAAAAAASRVRLKGSIAGMYSWFGGAAILLLTKLGGFLFDRWGHGAPFYMMAAFNGVLLVASLAIDVSRLVRKKS